MAENSGIEDADADGQRKVDEQAALWTAAWDHAKARFLTAGEAAK